MALSANSLTTDGTPLSPVWFSDGALLGPDLGQGIPIGIAADSTLFGSLSMARSQYDNFTGVGSGTEDESPGTVEMESEQAAAGISSEDPDGLFDAGHDTVAIIDPSVSWMVSGIGSGFYALSLESAGGPGAAVGLGAAAHFSDDRPSEDKVWSAVDRFFGSGGLTEFLATLDREAGTMTFESSDDPDLPHALRSAF